jgi:hypothetical protein
MPLPRAQAGFQRVRRGTSWARRTAPQSGASGDEISANGTSGATNDHRCATPVRVSFNTLHLELSCKMRDLHMLLRAVQGRAEAVSETCISNPRAVFTHGAQAPDRREGCAAHDGVVRRPSAHSRREYFCLWGD